MVELTIPLEAILVAEERPWYAQSIRQLKLILNRAFTCGHAIQVKMSSFVRGVRSFDALFAIWAF